MPIFRINDRHVLFIHVPKNGGTSVTAMLESVGEKLFDERIDLGRVGFRPRHLHGEILNRIFLPTMIDHAFLVVRNPVARMVSEYRYQSRRGGLRWQRLLHFDAWLSVSLSMAGRRPEYRENHFRPQVEYLCFGAEVHRMEDGLARIPARLSAVTCLAEMPEIPARNVTRKDRSVRMSKRSLSRILDRYAEDFERFGYTRDANAYDEFTE